MPNVWPISLFERTYGLYALLLAGLLDHPDLSDVVPKNLDHINIALREHNGLNFGETFSPRRGHDWRWDCGTRCNGT